MEKQIWQAEIIISAAFPLLPLLLVRSALSLGAPSELLLLLVQVSGLALRRGQVKVQSIKKEHSNSTYLRCGLWSTRALTQLGSGSGTGTAQTGAADWPAVHADDDKPEEAHKHEMMSYADECWRCLVASLQLPLAELTDFDFNLQWPRPVPWNAKAKAKAKQKPKAKSQMDKQSDEATNVF